MEQREIVFLRWVGNNGFKFGKLKLWWKWYDEWITMPDGSRAKGYMSFSEGQLFRMFLKNENQTDRIKNRQ